jgi:hypothetical protein
MRFVFGTAGSLVSFLLHLFDFGTIRPWQLQFPLSKLLRKKRKDRARLGFED